MVDVAGHLGMALVWLVPAWFLLERPRTAATFVGVGFWFGMLPDVDLVLKTVLPTVKHHGVFHTVLAVTVMAAVIGPAVGWLLRRWLDDTEWFSAAASAHATRFGFLLVWIPGLSHVFADMLSAPDIAEAIEPLWPIYQQSVGIDVVWYNNPWFNWGLLVVGLLLNVALFWSRRSSGSASAVSQ